MSEPRKVPDKELNKIAGAGQSISNDPPGHSPSVPVGKPSHVAVDENKDEGT